MRTLIWGKTFVRAIERIIKKHPALKNDIAETLSLLQENPFASRQAEREAGGFLGV